MAAEEQAGEPGLEDELARLKALKVQVPMELYIKLHQNKIINGDLLSEVVTKALQGYLEDELGAEDVRSSGA